MAKSKWMLWLSGACFGFGVCAILFTAIEYGIEYPSLYMTALFMIALSAYTFSSHVLLESTEELLERVRRAAKEKKA